MEYINNGDSASSIRTKLNLLIDYYNTNNVAGPVGPGTSGTSGAGTEGTAGTGGAGGAGGYTMITLYGSMMASLMGEDSIEAACSAASTGFSHMAYLVKAPNNFAFIPQTGDSIYYDSNLTAPIPSMKYYGFKDGGKNYNIYMGPGGVSSTTECV